MVIKALIVKETKEGIKEEEEEVIEEMDIEVDMVVDMDMAIIIMVITILLTLVSANIYRDSVDIKNKNKYLQMLKLLRKAIFGKFDIVISSGGNKLISVLLFLTGIKIRCGYDTGALSKKLLTYAVPLNKKQYACKMYHDLIKGLTKKITKML